MKIFADMAKKHSKGTKNGCRGSVEGLYHPAHLKFGTCTTDNKQKDTAS